MRRPRISMAVLVSLSFVLAVCSQGEIGRKEHGRVEGHFDVGGRQIYLSCTARIADAPTAILEAGMNETSATWSGIVPDIAKFTRVCTYDRAGLGRSDPGVPGRTARQLVTDLANVLRKSDITAPIILVGHSFGGLNVRLFAATYPKDVAGLVLIDSVHEDETAKWLEIIPPDIRKEMEDGGALVLRGGEDVNLRESERQLRAAKFTTTKPLIVLARGKASYNPANFPPKLRAYAPKGEELRVAMQRELASRSPIGRLIFAEKSGHFIHRDEPTLVVGSIREIVNASKP